jgi:hypothetical protein
LGTPFVPDAVLLPPLLGGREPFLLAAAGVADAGGHLPLASGRRPGTTLAPSHAARQGWLYVRPLAAHTGASERGQGHGLACCAPPFAAALEAAPGSPAAARKRTGPLLLLPPPPAPPTDMMDTVP